MLDSTNFVTLTEYHASSWMDKQIYFLVWFYYQDFMLINVLLSTDILEYYESWFGDLGKIL